MGVGLESVGRGEKGGRVGRSAGERSAGLECVLDDMSGMYLRACRLMRATSKYFRQFLAVTLLVLVADAFLSISRLINDLTTATPNIRELWFFLPTLFTFAVFVACLGAAAKMNHKYFDILRLGSELMCRLQRTRVTGLSGESLQQQQTN
jgi:hypothetical protein